MNTHSASSTEREKEAKILILITCDLAIGKCFPECFLREKKCFLRPPLVPTRNSPHGVPNALFDTPKTPLGLKFYISF